MSLNPDLAIDVADAIRSSTNPLRPGEATRPHSADVVRPARTGISTRPHSNGELTRPHRSGESTAAHSNELVQSDTLPPTPEFESTSLGPETAPNAERPGRPVTKLGKSIIWSNETRAADPKSRTRAHEIPGTNMDTRERAELENSKRGGERISTKVARWAANEARIAKEIVEEDSESIKRYTKLGYEFIKRKGMEYFRRLDIQASKAANSLFGEIARLSSDARPQIVASLVGLEDLLTAGQVELAEHVRRTSGHLNGETAPSEHTVASRTVPNEEISSLAA